MAVDVDEDVRDDLLEWEERVVGRVYETDAYDIDLTHFRVTGSFEQEETIEGQAITGRSFRYQWLETETREIDVEYGTATITLALDADKSQGTEPVESHRRKVKGGWYSVVNDGE